MLLPHRENVVPHSKNMGGGTSSTAAGFSLWAWPLPSVLPSVLPTVSPRGPIHMGHNASGRLRPVSCRDLPLPPPQPTQGTREVMEALAAKCRFFEESFLAEQMRSGALEGQLQASRANFKSAEESCQDLEQELELERAAAYAREGEIECLRLKLCEHQRLGFKEQATERAVEEASKASKEAKVLKDAVRELAKSKATLEVELASAARALVAEEQAHKASQERQRATLMQVARVLYPDCSPYPLHLTLYTGMFLSLGTRHVRAVGEGTGQGARGKRGRGFRWVREAGCRWVLQPCFLSLLQPCFLSACACVNEYLEKMICGEGDLLV